MKATVLFYEGKKDLLSSIGKVCMVFGLPSNGTLLTIIVTACDIPLLKDALALDLCIYINSYMFYINRITIF